MVIYDYWLGHFQGKFYNNITDFSADSGGGRYIRKSKSGFAIKWKLRTWGIPIPNSDHEFRFTIPIPNSDSEFRFWIPIPNSDSEFRFQIPIPNSDSEFQSMLEKDSNSGFDLGLRSWTCTGTRYPGSGGRGGQVTLFFFFINQLGVLY